MNAAQNTESVPAHIREQADAIAGQAEAIAQGTLVGPLEAAAGRILRNAETLLAWAKLAEQNDRSGATS